MEMDHQKVEHPAKEPNRHYYKLLVMALLSFAAMYILMYSMVNNFSNVYSNVNQFYMAALMTCPMIIIEIALMSAMYMNKRLNITLISVSTIALIAFFLLIRQQATVSDKQFLKSMIPHHASAILMCKQASIHDPKVKKLCEEIISGQQAEIDQMKAKLKELDK